MHELVVAGVAELACLGRGASVARMVLTRDLACDLELNKLSWSREDHKLDLGKIVLENIFGQGNIPGIEQT